MEIYQNQLCSISQTPMSLRYFLNSAKGHAVNFKTIMICRGEGVIDFHLQAISPATFNNAQFKASTNYCNNIPATIFIYETHGSDITDVIVSVPLLEFKHIVISAKIGAERFEKKFSKRSITLQSKINYALKPVKALDIREFYLENYSNNISIQPSCMNIDPNNQSQFLIRGRLVVPGKQENIELFFSDITGQKKNSIDFSFSHQSTKRGIACSVYSFSSRLVLKPNGGCIIAKSQSGRTGFFTLNPINFDPIYNHLSTRGYSLAKPGVYDLFQKKQKNLRKVYASTTNIAYDSAPLFSIVVPLFETPALFFQEMISSVLIQSYQKWELILVNASPSNATLKKLIDQIDDNRVKTISLNKNLGIANNTNAGVARAQGDFIFFLDHDDTIEPDALLRYWSYLQTYPNSDILYCDEDFLTEAHTYINPHFKPDFSIDLLRVHNYITHFLAVRSSLLDKDPLDPAYNGAQDYDLVLRLSEKTKHFTHIPEVLYHWRMSDQSTAKNANNKSYAIDAGKSALKAHLKRCGLPARVLDDEAACFYRVEYQIKNTPLVSIIIPNKDQVATLDRCLTSIQNKTTYENYEILIIENNSEQEATFAYYKKAEEKWSNLSVVYWANEFNYSAINNFGASVSKGKYLVLLNNDTEVISSNWIESLLGYCQRDDVGVVGAKLLYPDNSVQHAGIQIKKPKTALDSINPIHIFQQLDRDDPGYMRRAVIPQNVLAVTGACLMTKRSLYNDLSGLDEHLSVAYNDIDYCLKVHDSGLNIVFNPHALLYHHESISRGIDDETSSVNYTRFLSEQGILQAKWSKVLATDDPYHRFG